MTKGTTKQNKEEIDFVREPKGSIYMRLIDLASRNCDKFSLVWSEDLGNKKGENIIAKKLQPFILSNVATSKWPGTEIFGGFVNLSTYELNEETASVLKTVYGLYRWQGPHLPEDLAFYTRTGGLWLGSVAHEHMAWINRFAVAVEEMENLLSFLYGNGIIDRKAYPLDGAD